MFNNTDFNFTCNQRKEMKKLRTLVEDSNELEVGTDDVFLSKFLSSSEWQAENAYERMKRYYEFKFHHPDWVAHHSVQHFREHFYETVSKFVMPKPDKNGRVIIIFKTVDVFDKFPNYLYDSIEMDDLIFESLLLLPNVQNYGLTVIYDLSGTTKRLLRMLSPSFAKMINEKNGVMPLVSRILHLIQRGFLMHATTTLIMPFMSKEFRDKTFTHDGKNFDKLREMVGYENLPAEYGGPEENLINVDLIYNYLLRNAEYLIQLQNYKKMGIAVKEKKKK